MDLSEKKRKIVEMRNGLGPYNGVMHTLEEVGEEFQVTRERIRQIEAKVHEKIRDHEKAYRLRNFKINKKAISSNSFLKSNFFKI